MTHRKEELYKMLSLDDMPRYDLVSQLGSFDKWMGKVPQADQYQKVIEPPAVFYLEDQKVGIYVKLNPAEIAAGREVVLHAPYTDSRRTSGLPTRSAVFGAMPRLNVRNYYCRYTAASVEHPELLKRVVLFSKMIANYYVTYLPEAYRYHQGASDKIEKEYLLPDTPFTTCNFNINHAIKYHRDTGNEKGVFSNVIILRENCIGGYLVLPEFGIALSQSNGALILFDGQKLIHGVTDIQQVRADGYRCSIVLYALAAMANCYPYAEELEHAREKREVIHESFDRLADAAAAGKPYHMAAQGVVGEFLREQNKSKKKKAKGGMG